MPNSNNVSGGIAIWTAAIYEYYKAINSDIDVEIFPFTRKFSKTTIRFGKGYLLAFTNMVILSKSLNTDLRKTMSMRYMCVQVHQ